jgi:chromosome segregation and condensation protein ScpB
VETPLENSKPHGEALEELIGAQALSADLKSALVACLTGAESRRWTVGELFDRLNNLGVRCSKPAVLGALGELELEMTLCPFLPWSLVEHGTEWRLAPKSELLELLSGVRKLPGISSDTLTDEHKAVLLVVIGYRHKGGVSKTRIAEILGLEAAPCLEDLRKKELVYTAPGKELNWWRPTPEALLALGLRSSSDIPELKELERWFDSQKSFPTEIEKEANLDPILEKAQTSQARRSRRELERRASVPRGLEPASPDSGAENSPPPPRLKGSRAKNRSKSAFCPLPHPDFPARG